MKKSVRIIPFLLIVLLVVYFKPIPTAACSCMPPPPADVALSEATAVFSGEAMEVENNKGANGKTIHFKVGEIWKGVDSANVSVFTGNDSASCGIDFTVRKEYLVYAHTLDFTRINTNDGKLSCVYVCYPTPTNACEIVENIDIS
ncbi:hypothetical protein [Sporosarcina sp. G11-34]|uniref:hypothetical protein n=1 Tax=Sporosarcina sp. G11-34 TaxID=2849605 RepID=UPI0022A8EB79|nr:hypothetical protein [Sporosarcina sp. G11-34]MCZ2257321.1 hypothetical protein [Sporosarcina sp. G11-34]